MEGEEESNLPQTLVRIPIQQAEAAQRDAEAAEVAGERIVGVFRSDNKI